MHDSPCNTRSIGELSNSGHGLLGLRDMSLFVEFFSEVNYARPHGPLFCSDL